MKTQSVQVLSPKLLKSKQELIVETLPELAQKNWSSLKKAAKIREQSINFLWKACSKFSFKKDTLFLAIKIADLLIQENFRPFLQDFQLTSASLVILTTKYNQVYPVTIDQVSMITQKYYPREKYFEIEGSILQCLNFEIPQTTVYSELYNEMKKNHGKKVFSSDSDKQNNGDSQNCLRTTSQKNMKPDEDNLIAKTLKAIRQPECFKYGQQTLVQAVLSFIKNQKIQGNSMQMVKINYIRAILKKIFESEKVIEEKRRPSISKCVSPREQKLNPEKKFLRKQNILAL